MRGEAAMRHGGEAGTRAAGRPGAPAADWGAGHYESTAEQLLPAARAVVQSAAIRPGEHVLDLGCGTGNAALLAAEHTGQVTAVDPAPRLLEVARARAASEGRKVAFLPGEAASLPAADASVDVILSVFAVIFAPDPGAAATEMSRVLAPGGRIVLSAWIPAGAMFEMTSAAAGAVRQAVGAPAPEPFAWHDRDALPSLLTPYGSVIGVQHHPLAVAGLSVLGPLGRAQALRARLLAILENGNEDPGRFRVTSRYVIATARRDRRSEEHTSELQSR